MKDDDGAVPINEAINYLTHRNPTAVKALGEKFVEFSALLQPGMMMGDGDDEQPRKHTGHGNSRQIRKAAFVANLLATALIEAQSDVDQKLALARASIRRANMYQSWTQYLALLMSGTTLGLLGFDQSDAAQITSGAAVVGSLLGLASERILAVVDPAAGSYRGIFLKLVGLAEKVSALRREALIFVNFPGSDEALAALSGQTNSVCLEIKELGAQI